jgi:hypothetical protein
MNNRFCTFDEQPVRPLAKADKIYGTAQSRFDGQLYVHETPSVQGVPNCNRQFLEEVETYTEGNADSDT